MLNMMAIGPQRLAPAPDAPIRLDLRIEPD
jgi:hypothetical protein